MISRRGAIGAISGGLALIPAGRSRAATAPALETAEGRMRAFMLMRGALDDQLVIGWLSGRYWGCVNGALTPLFDVVAASFSRYRRLAEGGYRGVSIEQSYFIDRETGEWLGAFANPYTGHTVHAPTSANPATAITFNAKLDMGIAKPPPGLVLNHEVSPLMVQGDDVMMTEITSVGGVGKPTSYQGMVGLHARLREIQQSGATKVRCETSYASVSRWPPWLEMGDRPGETVANGQGAYGATLAGLPKPWLAAARRHRGELLTDPAGLLDPLWREG